MKSYKLHIKSHCEAPDYEDEVEAHNFDDALNHFMHSLGNNGWETDVVSEMIYCEDECPACHTDFEVKIETRDGYNFEDVAYCNGCGYMETRKGAL